MYGIYENGKVIGVFTAPLTVKSNQPVFVSDSLSLKRSRQKRSNQRWEINAGIRPETREANDLLVLLVSKSYTDPVDILMPQNTGVVMKRTRGTAVLASGDKGSTTVSVTTTAYIPKGCFIKFSNHNKVYMTVTDKTQQSNSIEIYPALLSPVLNGSFDWEDDVIMKAYFDTDVTTGMVYSDGILMDLGTIKLVEAL